MTRRSRRILLLIAVLAAIAGAYAYFGTHYVPSGQPPLATLDAGSIGALRDDFNRAAGETRILVLLSPT